MHNRHGMGPAGQAHPKFELPHPDKVFLGALAVASSTPQSLVNDKRPIQKGQVSDCDSGSAGSAGLHLASVKSSMRSSEIFCAAWTLYTDRSKVLQNCTGS
jgi:hypothetical protein